MEYTLCIIKQAYAHGVFGSKLSLFEGKKESPLWEYFPLDHLTQLEETARHYVRMLEAVIPKVKVTQRYFLSYCHPHQDFVINEDAQEFDNWEGVLDAPTKVAKW